MDEEGYLWSELDVYLDESNRTNVPQGMLTVL